MNTRPCSCTRFPEYSTGYENFCNKHFIPRGWKLSYHTLQKEDRDGIHLFLTGYCEQCYDCLEAVVPFSSGQSDSDVFAGIYAAMETAHPYAKESSVGYYGLCDHRDRWYKRRDAMPVSQRNQEFLNLFHPFDRPAARRWLMEHKPVDATKEVPLRDTDGELFCAVYQRAKEHGDLADVEPILDYVLPCEHESISAEPVVLTSYEFDFVSIVKFGGSEGIYVDCYLQGRFDQSGRSSLCIGTLKTLRADLEAAQIMGALCGTLMYHASAYVNENLDRYEPDKTPASDAEN